MINSTPPRNNHSQALDSLAYELDLWRTARPHTKVPIPNHFRQHALALTKSHRVSHVVKALKINGSMLKRWQIESEKNVASFPAPEENHFVSLPANLGLQEEASSLQFSITFPNQHSLTLEGHFSLPQLTALIKGVNPSCQEVEA